MTRRARCLALAAAFAALPSGTALAQGRGGGSNPQLDLSISPASITFASADPDVSPTVAAAPVVVSVRVRQNGGAWMLTVLAGGDLIAGPATVDITNVSWTATPAPPYQNGTLSKTVAQRLASGSGNVNPAANGSVTFRLANSWTYSAGNYTQTLVFTLSAP
ncbi:MAG TPA: hypothetical protein VFK57_20665 [Vicinamibacterales bacterium]|nr:hypothetical protein [Vicinamibacterales bacterium]